MPMDGGAGAPTTLPGHDAEALAFAIDGLARAWPQRSAKRRLTGAQALAGAAMVVIIAGAAILVGPLLGWIAITLASVLFVAMVALRLAAAAASLDPPPRLAKRWVDPEPVYTLLCPLYREADGVGALVAALARLDYPPERIDLKLILEADDHATIAAAERLAVAAEIVLVPPGGPRTKPKALNYALPRARGVFVTVFDAEDRPHPRQLRAALDAFAAGGPRLACVQAPLLIDNPGVSWIAGQFALEYAIHFRLMLPLLARLELAPILGGTSNHFRREALAASGGWDAYNVTEDADLGYRLARDGWRIAMIDPPTFEEAPRALPAWLRQRSRWIKGHIQTWLVLMRDPRTLHAELGAAQFWSLQAMLLGGALSAIGHGPAAAALAVISVQGSLAAGAWGWSLAIFGAATAGYCALAAAAATRAPRLALFAPTMPLYWPLASIAAAMALFDLIARPHYWAKTEHFPAERPDA